MHIHMYTRQTCTQTAPHSTFSFWTLLVKILSLSFFLLFILTLLLSIPFATESKSQVSPYVCCSQLCIVWFYTVCVIQVSQKNINSSISLHKRMMWLSKKEVSLIYFVYSTAFCPPPTPHSRYVLLTLPILSSALPHPHLPIGWPVEEPTCRQGLSPFSLLSSHNEQGSTVLSHCLPISISFINIVLHFNI